MAIGNQSIWTGLNAAGEPGIGLLEVIGFAWAANTITHVGLIDMALFRYAKKKIYGLCTSSGMLFGHFVAWIAAGIMGAGTAVLLNQSIVDLDPGDVAYYALGLSGFVIVIIAGWTTANANLYRAGLAAQAIFNNHSRKQTTLAVGVVTVIVACFPFVFTKMLPLLTYAGLLVVPVGAIVDFMLSVDDPMAVIDKMADADTKIVSLTITEGGYNFNPTTGAFAFDNPDVQHDLANPDSPRLVFGYLTAALKKRHAAGLPPFTVQSCDNIQHNGDMTKKMLLAFAGKQDPELAQWMGAHVCFPNAMVDRITPVTTPADSELLQIEFGVSDGWPVTCEPFCQWVIEDNFSNGRPQWEKVGAQFVPDVTPYEKMKIRLLNAGHSVLGLLGSIHGHETIDGAVSDPLFARYLRAFMDREATPVLDAVEGIDLEAYKDSLLERFGNPNIKDNLARICLESSAKLPKFLIATIHENLAEGGSIDYATLVIAAWCLYSDKGLSRHGVELDIVDAMRDELHAAAMGTEDDAFSFLKLESVFGDLAGNERFTALYKERVEALYKNPDITGQMENILAST